LGQAKSTTEHVEVVEAVPATYPPIAIVAKVAGTVTVRVTIASSGNVDSVEVLTGPQLLHKPAKIAAAKWVFNKWGKTNKKPRNAELHFIFEILPQGATSEELLPIFFPPFTVKVKEGLGRLDPLTSSTGD
jgi:TonB family protein